MENRNDIYIEENKLHIDIADLNVDTYIIFTFKENDENYATITDGYEFVWLLKQMEPETDGYVKYGLASDKEFNIFIPEIKQYLINNNIKTLDSKFSLASILDEQLEFMNSGEYKDVN